MEHPLESLGLLVRRAGLLVDNHEHGLDYAPALDRNPLRQTFRLGRHEVAWVPFALIFGLAVVGLVAAVLVVVAAVFFGPRVEGQAMQPWHEEQSRPAEAVVDGGGGHKAPGTLVLAGVFLVSFAVYYFANWMWLADVWGIQ